MIKIVTTALILIITLPTEIPWKSSNQLKWSDFKREPVKSSEYFAVTNSGIKYSWSSSFDGTSYAFSFEVNSYFNPNESWVKKGKKTDELLNHEQLHFNISELHARSLRSKLNNFEFTDDFKTEIDSIYNLDRPVIVAYLLIIVTFFVFLNLFVDILYSILDPRVRVKGANE